MTTIVRICLKNAVLGAMVFFILLAGRATGITAQAPAVSTDASNAVTVPKAVFSETTYDFNSIQEGAAVKHDFIVENHGNAVLEIQKVQPD